MATGALVLKNLNIRIHSANRLVLYMYYTETNTYKTISYLLKRIEVISTADSSYVAVIVLYHDFAEDIQVSITNLLCFNWRAW